MRSLSLRLLLSVCVLAVAPAIFAHDVTISGTQNFSSLDGSSLDHDGVVNGVFTVSDGNLIVNGVVNCNDDSTTSACSMTFNVSGNVTINSGGALYAENRSGGGTGGTITLTVGGNLALNGTAIVSTASNSSSGATGGAITATVGGTVSLASGTTIDSGSSNAAGGNISIVAGGAMSIDGNVLSGPSRTILSTKYTGVALDGGTSNSVGGQISIRSTSFSEPAVVISANANIVSQGDAGGAGPVTIEGCGIQVRGLVASLGRGTSASNVAIRSGKNLLIDGRDVGGSGTRMGNVRADAPTGTAVNRVLDVFAAGSIDLFGPASGSLFLLNSVSGVHDSKSFGGLIRVISTGDVLNGSGNLIDDGRSASGDSGGAVQLSAKGNVTLDAASIRSFGDSSTNNGNRGGGSVSVRSYSGNVSWQNGLGDVRPVGSASGLVPADQGSIVITACGTINTTGTSFPVIGTATSPLPETHTGVCSPSAPSLPAGVVLVTCNTPPVANPASATTNEDQSVTVHLSATDADGDSITFSIVTPPLHGSLGPVISTGPTTADVVYSPAADYFGSDSFVFRADDGNGGTDDETASITINPVNDPPSFLIGPTITVLEDSGAQSDPNWVTAISPGPANESSQTVTFTVTNDNPSLFSVQPAVSSNGTLTFTAAPNANGSATLTVTAHDDGGIANGGNDTSAPQSSSITVTPVNDAPSFTGGGNVTVNEDSGAYSAAWASGISAGPNESGQTVHFNVSNDNNALFSAQPAISPIGVLTFTPAANANGSATVTVTLQDDGGIANGGVDTSAAQTFTITVTAVNDAPSFTSGGDVTVLEDSGAYSAAWATAISAGPANESSQTVHFNIVSNSNAGLFSSAPAIAPDGTLSFTPAPNAFGSATIVVNLQDDGGIANGGVDTSANVTFTINVTGVNDAPSFTAGGNVTVNEDSGAYSAAWASAISAGPNEGGQIVHFNVSNDNHALFSSQPAISPAGVLTFTPAPNAFGTATVTVNLQDDGGTANGGVDTSGTVSFTITVNCVNDAPTAGNDSFTGFGNTELRVDLAANTTPTVVRTTGSGTGVLDNDADTVEGDPISITGVVGCGDVTAPFDCTLASGTLHLNANGSFSFVPNPSVTSASFQYTVTDQPSCSGSPASATGTVTLTFNEMIWYVNGSAAPGGNGTSVSPFNSFTSLNGVGGLGDVDAAGAIIFVHDSNVAGGIELEANQHLIGEGVGLTVSAYALVPAGTKPRVFGGTVLVNQVTGVEIAGLELSSSTGDAVSVTSSGIGAAGASIHDNLISSATGRGIKVNAGGLGGTTVTVNNTSITSTGNGFDVDSFAGAAAVAYSNGSITSGGIGVRMDGSMSGNLSITALSNVTIDGNTVGDGISINGAKFDAVPGGAFNVVSGGTITVGSGSNPVGGAGVLMNNVSGDYAIGSLSAFAGTGAGVSIAGSGLFTGSAGMRVTNGGGTIVAPSNTGLNVTNATIGAANLVFTSISSGTAVSGPVNGIVVDTTGTSGGLVVTGTGSAASGGTIQKTTGAGVKLNATSNVSLSWMDVKNGTDDGINGVAVAGFALSHCNVTGNGDSGTDEGVQLTNVSGAVTLADSAFSGSAHNNVWISNTGTAISALNVTNSSFSTNSATFGNDGLLLETFGAATIGSSAVTNCTFNGNKATGLQLAQNGGTLTLLDVSASQFTNNNIHADFSKSGTASISFKLRNSALTGANSHAVNVSTAAGASTGGTLAGRLEGNTIGNAGIAGSGSAIGNGMRININGNSPAAVLVDNNIIRQTPFGRGIEAIGRNGTGGLDITITNNDVNPQDTSGFPLAAIFVQSNAATVANTVRADIRLNTVPAGAATGEVLPTFISYLRSGTSTAQLVDTPPPSATATAQLTSTNTGSASASATVTLIPGPINVP